MNDIHAALFDPCVYACDCCGTPLPPTHTDAHCECGGIFSRVPEFIATTPPRNAEHERLIADASMRGITLDIIDAENL